MLLHNLPVLLKGLCDFTLAEGRIDIALASVIDVVENVGYDVRC